MSYDRKIKRRRRHVSPIRIQVLTPPIVLAGSLIWNLSPKVRGKKEKAPRPSRIQVLTPPIVLAGSLIWNLSPKVRGKKEKAPRPSRIQVLTPPIIPAGGLIWNLSPKVRDKREKHVKPKIQIIIPPPVVGVLIWNLYPKLGKIRPKRVYTKAGKPQVLAPPIAVAGSLIYTLRPKVYDKKDRRKERTFKCRVFIPIHSGATAVIARLIGEPFTPSDAVDAAAFVLSEITGAAYSAVDGVEGAPT